MTLALDGASAGTLRALATALRNGQIGLPLSAFSITRVVPSCSGAATQAVMELSADGMQPAHLALLLDAMAAAVEARLASAAELVWTGPDGPGAHSRDTAVVIAELFRSAMTSVVVSTFVVHRPDTVFKALAERMEQVPGLNVQLFVHVGREGHDTRHESEILREFASDLRQKWPGPRRPSLYYYPRSLQLDPADRASWHAKSVVVDDAVALVTSANFTEWAHQRNVEAGVLVRDRQLLAQLRGQFDGLVRTQQVKRVPGL